jgi:hypothetical protein
VDEKEVDGGWRRLEEAGRGGAESKFYFEIAFKTSVYEFCS